jgi:hypothetical protein
MGKTLAASLAVIAVIWSACGGEVAAYPCCPPSQHICVATYSCCTNEEVCGNGVNGCPLGGCCLLSTEPGGPTPDKTGLCLPEGGAEAAAR